VRADAARNRERILASARELFLTRGVDVPLDHIAQHAGVSIATFYRRFPERLDLVKAIAFEEVTEMCARVEAACRDLDAGHGRQAWEDFVLDSVAAPQGKLMPLLAAGFSHLVADDPQVAQSQAKVTESIDRLLAAARRHGLLRAELEPVEVMAFLMVAGRPIPIVAEAASDRLTFRMVQVVLAGLRPDAEHPIQGAPLTIADLPGGPPGATARSAKPTQCPGPGTSPTG